MVANFVVLSARARAVLISIFAVALISCGNTQTVRTEGSTTAPSPPPPSATTPTDTTTSTATYHETWPERAIGNVAIFLDSAGRPICNGAMVGGGRRHAVSVASCHGAMLVHFRYDSSRDPVSVRRTQSGPIAIYELDQDAQNDWPRAPAGALPGSQDEVLALAFANLGHEWAPSQPCHLRSRSNGALLTDCVNPSSLPGTALFNADGLLAGLMNDNGTVLGAEQIRSILRPLNVPLD